MVDALTRLPAFLPRSPRSKTGAVPYGKKVTAVEDRRTEGPATAHTKEYETNPRST